MAGASVSEDYLPRHFDDDDDEVDKPLIAGAKSTLAPERKIKVWEHAGLAAYWFGWSFLFLPLMVVVIPLQVTRLADDGSKGAALARALLLGSFVSLFAAPTFGSISDYYTHRYVRLSAPLFLSRAPPSARLGT